MVFLSPIEKEKIKQAIQQAEVKTSGEIVTVIAKASSRYTYIAWCWALLIGLVGAQLPFIVLGYYFPFFIAEQWHFFVDGQWHLIRQLSLAMLLMLLFRITPIKMAFVRKKLKARKTSRYALEHFYRHGLHHTPERNGILIFVSLAEHKVHILADTGIDQKCGKGYWESEIQEFTQRLKEGRVCDGFVTMIEHCGKTLQEHFPLTSAKHIDHLPNHLIEDATEGD